MIGPLEHDIEADTDARLLSELLGCTRWLREECHNSKVPGHGLRVNALASEPSAAGMSMFTAARGSKKLMAPLPSSAMFT